MFSNDKGNKSSHPLKSPARRVQYAMALAEFRNNMRNKQNKTVQAALGMGNEIDLQKEYAKVLEESAQLAENNRQLTEKNQKQQNNPEINIENEERKRMLAKQLAEEETYRQAQLKEEEQKRAQRERALNEEQKQYKEKIKKEDEERKARQAQEENQRRKESLEREKKEKDQRDAQIKRENKKLAKKRHKNEEEQNEYKTFVVNRDEQAKAAHKKLMVEEEQRQKEKRAKEEQENKQRAEKIAKEFQEMKEQKAEQIAKENTYRQERLRQESQESIARRNEYEKTLASFQDELGEELPCVFDAREEELKKRKAEDLQKQGQTPNSPVSTKPEPKKDLYIWAYERQERQHKNRRFLGRFGALIAGIIPPLSLFFTINELANRKNNTSNPPLAGQIVVAILAAIFPIVSGIAAWVAVNAAEKRRRKQDVIVKVFQYPILEKKFNELAKKEKQNRAEKKEKFITNKDIDPLKEYKVNKPRKVHLIRNHRSFGNLCNTFMDLNQKRRDDAYKNESNLNLGFFQKSYEASKVDVDNLEKEYQAYQAKHPKKFK